MIPVPGRGVINTRTSKVVALAGRRVVPVADINELRRLVRSGRVSIAVCPRSLGTPAPQNPAELARALRNAASGWQEHVVTRGDLHGPQSRTRLLRAERRKLRVGVVELPAAERISDRIERLPGMTRHLHVLPDSEVSRTLYAEYNIAAYTTSGDALILVQGRQSAPPGRTQVLGITATVTPDAGPEPDLTISWCDADGRRRHATAAVPRDTTISPHRPGEGSAVLAAQAATYGALGATLGEYVKLGVAPLGGVLPGAALGRQAARTWEMNERAGAELKWIVSGGHPAAVRVMMEPGILRTGGTLTLTRNRRVDFPAPDQRKVPAVRAAFEHQLTLVQEAHLAAAAHRHHQDLHGGGDRETAAASLRRREHLIATIADRYRERYRTGLGEPAGGPAFRSPAALLSDCGDAVPPDLAPSGRGRRAG